VTHRGECFDWPRKSQRLKTLCCIEFEFIWSCDGSVGNVTWQRAGKPKKLFRIQGRERNIFFFQASGAARMPTQLLLLSNSRFNRPARDADYSSSLMPKLRTLSTANLLPRVPSFYAQVQIKFHLTFSVRYSHPSLVYICFIRSRISRCIMIEFSTFSTFSCSECNAMTGIVVRRLEQGL